MENRETNEYESTASSDVENPDRPMSDNTNGNALRGPEAEASHERERFAREVAEYRDLIAKVTEFVKPPGTGSTEISLAFLLERKKAANPEGWTADMATLKEQLEEKSREGGAKEAGWLLNREVAAAYANYLDQLAAGAETDERRGRLEMMKQVFEQMNDFKKERYQKGGVVSSGGVSADYAPAWLKFTK